MKRYLIALSLLAALLAPAAAHAVDQICVPLGTCTTLPEPPPGGRKCDSRGSTTIAVGELAVYTGANNTGWCITLPGGYYPNLSTYMFTFNVSSINDKRSSVPPMPSIGYSGTNYTGSTMSLNYGNYPNLSFTPRSIKVN